MSSVAVQNSWAWTFIIDFGLVCVTNLSILKVHLRANQNGGLVYSYELIHLPQCWTGAEIIVQYNNIVIQVLTKKDYIFLIYLFSTALFTI